MTLEEFALMRETLDTTDYDYLHVMEDIIERIENFDSEDEIYQAIDDSLIYYKDQWTILQHFFVPQDANWNEACEYLLDDVFNVARAIRKYREEKN